MPNYPYDVEKYNSMLKSEVVSLTVIGVFIAILFVFMIMYSVGMIKKDKTKKFPYIQLILVVVLSVFLLVSLVSQIGLFKKDIAEEAYVQYEGPANIKEEHRIIFGSVPTKDIEYIISFEQGGKQIELSMKKDYGLRGDVEKIYVVYSQRSKFILEFAE